MPYQFINPYNFVSTPLPRPTGALGDRDPEPLGKFAPGLLSGEFTIRMTTRTPLLLSEEDVAPPRNSARRTRTRRDADGVPLMLGTTLKGTLRAAYEAITNSRYGAFDEETHRLPGAMRAPATYASEGLYPGWISAVDADGLATEISGVDLLAPETFGADTPGGDPSPGAWLPRGVGRAAARKAALPADDLDCREATAWLVLQQHPERPRQRAFNLWRVTDLALDGQTLPESAGTPENDTWNHRDFTTAIKVRGRIHWTAADFGPRGNGKHDERLFVTEVLGTGHRVEFSDWTEPLTEDLRLAWESVIDSYARAHEHENDQTGLGTYITQKKRWRLTLGRTLWTKWTGRNADMLSAVSPAMIGRVVHDRSPLSLVSDDHRVPGALRDASPADRLFGFVGRNRDGDTVAARGRLYVEQPTTTAAASKLRTFDPPLPLAVLNGPKTSQWLFYSAPKPGTNGRRTFRKDGGFRAGDGLRGRKFYVPHKQTFDDDGYWTRANDGRPREFTRPDGAPPQVAGEITDWVAPGAVFHARVGFRDLDPAELGALLWLLQLPEGHSHTMGLGRPLGFGAIRFDIVDGSAIIRSGEDTRRRYRSLRAAAAPPAATGTVDAAIAAYEREVTGDRGLSTVQREFLALTRGFDAPVHYPRASEEPEAESYLWWVGQRRDHQRSNDWNPISLPFLGSGAPVLGLPTEQPDRGAQRPGGNRGRNPNRNERSGNRPERPEGGNPGGRGPGYRGPKPAPGPRPRGRS